jgi:hypothetical protein
MFGGLLLAACGALWVFMLYLFGTMMDPNIQGAAREAAIWRNVVSEPTFPFGVIVIIAGVWLMFRRPRPTA